MTEMTLQRIAEEIGGRLLNVDDPRQEIESVVSSSRDARPGSLFVAYKGVRVDGHRFIAEALEQGSAAAVVTDPEALGGQPGILVEDSQRALSQLHALVQGNPSRRLLTVGVTGTNGKTTTHWMLSHALARLDRPGLRIGSLGISGQGLVERSGKVTTPDAGQILMTTPAASEIHESMRLAVEAGLKSCVLETSSHALDQHRVSDVRYDAAVFTNLSEEHLNYHRGMEDYFAAKTRLFELLAHNEARQGGAAVNRDCPWGLRLIDHLRALDMDVLSFGVASGSDVHIVDFDQGLPQSRLTVEYAGERLAMTLPMIGDYNASNLAGAFACLLTLGFDPRQVARSLDDLPSVPGRLEAVGDERIAVFVDYAHTGEGLRHLLAGIKPFVKQDLWVLFGCGGGKDPGKRRAMGEAATELADRIVLTNDNPKNEDPAKIIDEILESGCQPEFVELDRGSAIERTLRSAREGDVVVLAGKGHEDYQIIGGETFHFSDSELARRLRDEGVLGAGWEPVQEPKR